MHSIDIDLRVIGFMHIDRLATIFWKTAKKYETDKDEADKKRADK